MKLSMSLLAFAKSPMVFIPLLLSFFLVADPTYSKSSTGKGQTISLCFSLGMDVQASGFLISEPNLAVTLSCDRPIETVMPNSLYIRFLIISISNSACL